LPKLHDYLGFPSAIVLALLIGGCVDQEQVGVSTGLLILSPSEQSLKPGATAQIALQAVDGNGDGVPDQAVEVVITDLSRLHFKDTPNNRSVFMTSRSESTNGVVLAGAVVVGLVVPADAKPGAVAVVASLGGDKGATSKTQWANFDIETAGGGEAGAGGAGGEAGAGGAAGASGSGGASGGGGMAGAAGAENQAGAGGVMGSAGAGN